MLASLLFRAAVLALVIGAANPAAATPLARVWQSKTTTALTEGEVEVAASHKDVIAALKSVDKWSSVFKDMRSVRPKPSAACPAAVEIDSQALAHAHVFCPTWRDDGVRLELDGHGGMTLWIDLRAVEIDAAQTRVHGRLFLEVAGPMGWFTSEKDLGARRERKLRSDLDDLARYLAKASKG